jgi:hypothetical protein
MGDERDSQHQISKKLEYAAVLVHTVWLCKQAF